jgi:hypothetical protein
MKKENPPKKGLENAEPPKKGGTPNNNKKWKNGEGAPT